MTAILNGAETIGEATTTGRFFVPRGVVEHLDLEAIDVMRSTIAAGAVSLRNGGPWAHGEEEALLDNVRQLDRQIRLGKGIFRVFVPINFARGAQPQKDLLKEFGIGQIGAARVIEFDSARLTASTVLPRPNGRYNYEPVWDARIKLPSKEISPPIDAKFPPPEYLGDWFRFPLETVNINLLEPTSVTT